MTFSEDFAPFAPRTASPGVANTTLFSFIEASPCSAHRTVAVRIGIRIRRHWGSIRWERTTRDRDSIYQRLVNRLAHVPDGAAKGVLEGEGENERTTEVAAAKPAAAKRERHERGKGSEGADGHRGRDVDDRKTKIRNSNLSREQLISRTSPPSSFSVTSPFPRADPLSAAATDTVVSASLGWRGPPPCRQPPTTTAHERAQVSRSFVLRFLR